MARWALTLPHLCSSLMGPQLGCPHPKSILLMGSKILPLWATDPCHTGDALCWGDAEKPAWGAGED